MRRSTQRCIRMKKFSTQWCVEKRELILKKFMDIVFEKFNWIVILKVIGLQIVLWRLIIEFLIVIWVPVCYLGS